MPRKNSPYRKEIRRKDAEARAVEAAKRGLHERIVDLDKYGFTAAKERLKIHDKIARL